MLDIIALAILLIVFAAIVNYVRTMRRAHGKRQNPNKYHAVAIDKHNRACTAAAKLVGRRYLSNEAPRLPLTGCSADSCRCRYVHYADRRSEDRRFPFGVRKSSEPQATGIERRSSERRKANDFVLG